MATIAWSAEPTPDRELITPATRAAVDKGMAWLLARQHEDGTWSRTGGATDSPGMTAIATLALLACEQKQPALAQGIAKGVAHLRGRPGMIGAHMYDHAFATTCLAEAAITTGDSSLRGDIERAVQVIVQAQNLDGGWRYTPVPHDADLSMTAAQVVAMRAALLAGVQVPGPTLARAITYIRGCCSPTGDGGFGYMPSAESGFARTGAACFTLLGVVGDDRMVQEGLAYLLRFRPLGPTELTQPFWWYGHYYAAAAIHMAQATGPVQQQVWVDWYASLSRDFIARQDIDGHWTEAADDKHGDATAKSGDDTLGKASSVDPLPTALACIILMLPSDRLPVYSPKFHIGLFAQSNADQPPRGPGDSTNTQSHPAGSF